jgi:16S rRNA (guanine966-N2)-methyltransferase
VGRLRIIAGELRGRKILVPDRSPVRPTGDRVREALFDILGPAVTGARVLDAFAGSGALGLEAASRGAASVAFVESDRGIARALGENVSRLGLAGRCTVAVGEATHLVGHTPVLAGPFDLVLADPPYRMADLAPFLRAAAAVLASDGTLVVERDRHVAPILREGTIALGRSETYGRARLDFYRKSAGSGESGPG